MSYLDNPIPSNVRKRREKRSKSSPIIKSDSLEQTNSPKRERRRRQASSQLEDAVITNFSLPDTSPIPKAEESDPSPRKRRRRTYSDSEESVIANSPLPEASLIPNAEEANPSPRKRRRRTRSDSEEPTITSSPTAESVPEESNVFIPETLIPLPQNDINQIRAELLKEHSYPFAGSDFSDESHDWSSDSENFSEEYWHFLGRFE